MQSYPYIDVTTFQALPSAAIQILLEQGPILKWPTGSVMLL